MRTSKILINFFFIGGIAVIVSGCTTSSNPTTADLMRDHRFDVEIHAQAESELKDQLAQNWENGHKLIASGRKNIEVGEKRIASAESDLTKGKNQVELGRQELAEGNELVRVSELRFREEFKDVGQIGSR